jgi:predicted dehydrogenase
MQAPISVGLIGSQFISAIHAESLQHCPQAVLAAVASPTAGNAQALARRFGIPCALTDYRDLLAKPEIQMVVVDIPNHLHRQVVLDAAAAGKSTTARTLRIFGMSSAAAAA